MPRRSPTARSSREAEQGLPLTPDTETELADGALDAGQAEPEDADDGTAGVYFPPTDPVVTTDTRGRVQVLGGFSATSMDSVEVEPSASDTLPGDEALADAIRRELREDALTTDLAVRATVRRGVASLRGTVPGLADAENAEEVAGRVPGVREVVERLALARM